MADEIRVNRQPSMARGDGSGDMQQYAPSPRGSKMPWIVLAVVIVVLIVLGVLFRDRLFPASSDKMTGGSTPKVEKSSGYQAVFLTNGQVYFGKLSGETGSYATLKDIYYLQVTQPPLQGSQQQGQQQAQAQPQLSLVKLGNELHGPVDTMQINRDQILFYEDMKEDAKVIQAINDYKKDPNAGNTPTTPAPTTPVK